MNICHSACAELFDKMQSSFHSAFGRVFVNAFFKSLGRIGSFSEHSRRSSDVIALEFGAFEHNAFRGILYLAVKSAHNSRQGHGLYAVANDEIVVI